MTRTLRGHTSNYQSIIGNLIDIGEISPQEGLAQARAAAEKALALDETLADAYYNIGRKGNLNFNGRARNWLSSEPSN